MKKNIIIGILTVISALSISYGFYESNRADKNEVIANEHKRIAREMKIEAENQMKIAAEQRKIAEINAMRAMKTKGTSDD